MSLTLIVLLVLVLYVFQIFLQEVSGHWTNLGAIVGNRDTAPDLSQVAARLNRAKNNMLEALPLFLGLSMLVLVRGGDTTMASWAAMGFLVARMLYVPAYVSGLPWLRSIIWFAGMVSLFVMALTLL
ncbi:MAG: MAPEG family protein [Hyphomicrobiaceae bacterium]|nr:MAPEG family protein [Hyphomicrobiaceae bacterium]